MCINCGDGSPGYDAPRWKFKRWEHETEAVKTLQEEEIFDRTDPEDDIYFLQAMIEQLKQLGWTIKYPNQPEDVEW